MQVNSFSYIDKFFSEENPALVDIMCIVSQFLYIRSRGVRNAQGAVLSHTNVVRWKRREWSPDAREGLAPGLLCQYYESKLLAVYMNILELA